MSFEPRPDPSPPASPQPPPLPVWALPVSPGDHSAAGPTSAAPAAPGAAAQRKPKAGRMRFAAGVLAVLVLGAAGLWMLRDRLPLPRQWRRTETAGQSYREMRQALASPGQAGAGVSAADLAGVDAMLTQLATASRQGDAARFLSVFDVDRLADEVIARGDFPRHVRTGGGREVFVHGFRQGLSERLDTWKVTFGWARHRVRRVERTGGDGVVVYLTSYDDDGITNRLRIWARRQPAGNWAAYDFEELMGGVRVSTAAAMASSRGNVAPWVGGMTALGDAGVAIDQGDLDAAERALARVESVTFPPEVDGLRLIVKASVQIQRGQYEAALATLDLAAAARPDSPMPDYMRAQAYAWLERHDESLAAATRFEATFGPEADNLYAKGAALEHLGRVPEAIAAYRAGLDDEPDSFDNLVGLGLVLPADGKAELGERFARSTMSPELFRQIAGHFDDSDDAAALRAVLDAYAGKRPADPFAGYFEARLHARADRYDEAAAAAQAAMPRASGDDLASLRDAYFDAMHRSGKTLEAYHTAAAGEDRAAAFRDLSARLQQADDSKGLTALVEARRADAPDDAYAHYSQGWVYHAKGDLAAADLAYAAAASAGGLDDAWAGVLRDVRVDVRYRLGRGPSALDDIGPADQTFTQLASLYAGDRDANGLTGLLAARGAAEPSDRNLPLWEAELAWLREDYAAAADLFLKEYRAAEARAKADGASGGVDSPLPMESRIVSSLLRAGRDAQALRFARREQEMYDTSYFLLWVHAAAGRVKEAKDAFRSCLAAGTSASDLYDSPDVGPLLKSDAFRSLRETFPPEEAATQPAAGEPGNAPGANPATRGATPHDQNAALAGPPADL